MLLLRLVFAFFERWLDKELLLYLTFTFCDYMLPNPREQ
jgi:hypothetical protein